MEIMLRHNENLKVVAEEHEQLKIAFAEQSQRSVVISLSWEQGLIHFWASLELENQKKRWGRIRKAT